MISIIIPAYNAGKILQKTIDSILSQSYKNWEVIVVLDGIDNEIKTLLGAKYPIIKVLEQEHKGANSARNYGARVAKGEYLFFCDADIVLKKDVLKKLKNALDKNFNASYAYCSFLHGFKKIKSRPFNDKELKIRNYISTMSLIRAKDFIGFDENIEKFQDWDLWLTMLEQGKKGIFINEVLFYAKPSRYGKSQWLPKILYHIPWLRAVKKYNQALAIIKKKHNL